MQALPPAGSPCTPRWHNYHGPDGPWCPDPTRHLTRCVVCSACAGVIVPAPKSAKLLNWAAYVLGANHRPPCCVPPFASAHVVAVAVSLVHRHD